MVCFMWVVWDVTLSHWLCCSCHLNKHSAFMHMSSKQSYVVFMFVLCINIIKALFYYSKLMHTIIKS